MQAMLGQYLNRLPFTMAEIVHQRQWWGVARGLRIGWGYHQVHKFGLALVEEGLELMALRFVVGLFQRDVFDARHGVLFGGC
jgi:hypothetical protein